MFTKNKWFIAGLALVLALASAFVFTACEDLYSSQPVIVDPVTPEITKQPEGGSYTLGASPVLTVAASVSDGGTLSYAWFIAAGVEDYNDGNGEPVAGAAAASYTIPADTGEGQHLYYVVVTNSTGVGEPASVKSRMARVVINDPANAQTPYIKTEPAGKVYDWSTPVAIDPISVEAVVTDGGALTYQWYSADTYTATAGTLISGAASASYTPGISAAGTYYYYVVVTNTNNSVSGVKVKTSVSLPAVIRAIAANATIKVSGAQNQYVRGFGVMVPFWGNSPQDSVEDYELMLNPNKLGYNMLRVMIPVVPEEEGSVTDMREVMKMAMDNKLSVDKDKGITRDRSHYYEIVKVANKYNGYVLASPWSPPPAWKTNGSYKGGSAGAKAVLKKEYWGDYGEYLKEYCKIMSENGAPVYAVSIQNEPNYPANYDGCEWTGVEMRDFFKMVGRFTEGVKGFGGGKSIPTVLTMFGESANSPTDSLTGLNDPEASQYIDLYARHLYGSPQVVVSREVQAKGKEIWMTEHNINGGNEASYPMDSTYNYMWKFLNDVDVSIRMNKENAFIWWYGKRFYSMIGDGDNGTVNGAILPRGWALSHYAKYASETDQIELTIEGTAAGGAAISVGGTGNFNHTSYNIDSTAARATAFMSPDGNSISLVMFTPTDSTGSGGVNMGDIRIEFPSGFKAAKVTAMRSRGPRAGQSHIQNMGKADTDTVLLEDGAAALVNLPRGQILSVKFTK